LVKVIAKSVELRLGKRKGREGKGRGRERVGV
jgi:hypothetical protein